MLKFVFLFAIALSAEAHVPEIGQIIRFQPQMLRTSKPFAMKGTASAGKYRMESLLEWSAPGTYKVTLKDIPPQFYASGEGSGSWVLYRQGAKCSLKTDSMTMSCPAAGFWGAMELSAQPVEVVSSLVESGFIREEESSYAETDTRNPQKDPRDKNVRVAIGTNGNAPNGRSLMAVLEIRGARYNSEIPGEEFPILQYDQTFLSPLLARFSQEGEVVTIRALSDLVMATRKTRFTPIVSSRLDFVVGKNVRTSFVRQEPAPLKSPAGVVPPRGTGDIANLRDQLSVEGQSFLRALLISH